MYVFLVLTLASAGVTFVLYSWNAISAGGRFFSSYYGDIQAWKTQGLAAKMGQVAVSFKINPMMDSLRNRDQFPMEHRGYVNSEDKILITWKDFFSYDQSYFWYNNTVKQFPNFAYDDS